MKFRWFVYSSLLFVILALPFVYQHMNNNIHEQEYFIRQQKKEWLTDTANIDFALARRANNAAEFWYHYRRGGDYFILYLEMLQEELHNINL